LWPLERSMFAGQSGGMRQASLPRH
jgi:hypothetical protein